MTSEHEYKLIHARRILAQMPEEDLIFLLNMAGVLPHSIHVFRIEQLLITLRIDTGVGVSCNPERTPE